MEKMLVPESWLSDKDTEISILVGEASRAYAINIDDSDYGSAFRYFLLFSVRGDFISKAFPGMTQSRGAVASASSFCQSMRCG